MPKAYAALERIPRRREHFKTSQDFDSHEYGVRTSADAQRKRTAMAAGKFSVIVQGKDSMEDCGMRNPADPLEHCVARCSHVGSGQGDSDCHGRPPPGCALARFT